MKSVKSVDTRQDTGSYDMTFAIGRTIQRLSRKPIIPMIKKLGITTHGIKFNNCTFLVMEDHAMV
jgi:hypothetical protein